MSQTWTDDVFAGGHDAQTDLQNMENNFACLKSMFSGASAPANTAAGMPWFDTSKKVLKMRDTADAAWIGLMHGDTSQKMWVYRNAAMDGWAIDSSVTDKVLALKGGSTYVTGGASAGSWTLGGITVPNHTHDLPIGFTSAYPVNAGLCFVPQYGAAKAWSYRTLDELGVASSTDYMFQSYSAALTISHDGTSRPAAAVGTLQYLNL